jgi:hypothetical protein
MSDRLRVALGVACLPLFFRPGRGMVPAFLSGLFQAPRPKLNFTD